uniref:Uncharacterized protein n=1 Tax=Salix viminalis TaxID=40686 RepID=A0A6N2M4Y8_SALVM
MIINKLAIKPPSLLCIYKKPILSFGRNWVLELQYEQQKLPCVRLRHISFPDRIVEFHSSKSGRNRQQH